MRPVTPVDFPALYEYQLDPEATSMAVVRSRGREDFWAHWTKIIADSNVMLRAIVVDRRVVGNVTCFKMEGVDAIGYWLARDAWGKGIATRALSMFLQEVPIRPLHAFAASTNRASQRVVEKCGFRFVQHRWSPETEIFPACEEMVYVLE